jgi:putative aldouronate transport system substrate-binding protein
MRKKPILVIVITLLCLLFAACDISDAPTNTSKPAEKTAEPTASADASETTDPNRPALLKNPNVTNPGQLPVCKEMETLTMAIAQAGTVTSYEYGENYTITYLQDQTNVKLDLQLYPATDANQKIELLITSGAELPDMISGMGIDNDAVRAKYGQAGALIPLNDYYDQLSYHFDEILALFSGATESMPKEKMMDYVKSADGNLYATINYTYTLPDSYSNRAWINQKWLDELGLKEPATSEELVNVLKAFKEQDPNKNGQKDEIPMVGANGGWNTNPIMYLMNQFIYTSTIGTSYYSRLANGKIDPTFDKEEWREGLRYIKRLVDEELLSTLSFTQDGSQYNAMVSGETQIVGVGVSGSISSYQNNKVDYSPLGAIEGSNGARWFTYTPQLPEGMVAITKDCKSPDLAFRWMDFGYTEDYSMIARFGEPGVDWDYADEGTTLYADLGYEPYFKMYNNIWGTEQQKHLQGGPIARVQSTIQNQGEVWSGDQNNNEYKNMLTVAKLVDYVPPMEDIIQKINYTQDEIDQFNEIRTNLVSYVDESMVRFVMGDLDLDKDWDSYLNELEKLQYKQLVEMDQAAFDRSFGK